LTGDQIEALHKALGDVKVLAPPASCVVPIGEPLIEAGLRRRFPRAEFVASVTRPPSVYRGNPFVIECAIAYGGDLPRDESADVMRFANRVPLQYQPKACAMSEAVYDTNWKAYELQQPRGSLPIGPLAVLIHLASVWVPFTSEAKEAVAHYPELLREMRLALQECGRKLGTHLRARSRAESALRRRSIFERYIPEIGYAIHRINGADADTVIQAFLDALPSFAGTIEAEDAAPEEPTPVVPSTPSMPPPDDVIAEEPPDSGANRTKKAAVASIVEEEPAPAEAKIPPAIGAVVATISEQKPEPGKAKKPVSSPVKPTAPAPPAPSKAKKGVREAAPSSKHAPRAASRKATAVASKPGKKHGSARSGRQLELVR
jgi:hypothetical protein